MRHSSKEDLTLRSFKVLSEKTNSLMGKNAIYVDPLNKDFQRSYIHLFMKNKIADCILVGNPVSRILELAEMPIGKLRIFTFSSAGKSLLETFFGFKHEQVSSIDRYELFPKNRESTFNEISIPMNFVFSGRLATAKGILHVLEFIYTLQTVFYLPAQLHIFGGFSEMIPYNFRSEKLSNQNLEISIQSIVSRPDWIWKPRFYGALPEDKWLNQVPKGSIYINLSQHSHEDFGVSLARAQQKNLPCILSKWGSHLDVKGNVFFASEIDVFSSAEKIKVQTKKLAKSYVEFLQQNRPPSNFNISADLIPETMNITSVHLAASKFYKKFPNYPKKPGDPRLIRYIYSSEGAKFYKAFNKIMNGYF